MPHRSDTARRLTVRETAIASPDDLPGAAEGFAGVCVVALPPCPPGGHGSRLDGVGEIVARAAQRLAPGATLVTIGEPMDLLAVEGALSRPPGDLRFQHWIALKRADAVESSDRRTLARGHFGALVHTRYDAPLRHVPTRVAYSYCPACGKTTKDYGGKKHTYHQYGTLASDVWRDEDWNLDGDLASLFERFADFFGLPEYERLLALDARRAQWPRAKGQEKSLERNAQAAGNAIESRLANADCLPALAEIPDNSVDFAFADPPYNLKKTYAGYADDREVAAYFAWCDQWISELARVVRPGGTCAILNIPLWAARHALFLETVLDFQAWIVWDALSFPVRRLMPAHYAVVCFSKGRPRPLPGLAPNAGAPIPLPTGETIAPLRPLADRFCIRPACMAARARSGPPIPSIASTPSLSSTLSEHAATDARPLTDLFADIHRLKHNCRRVDHPCQLPPALLFRLIALFTRPGEVALDPFNGAGTTTLAAHLLGRRYIGVESSLAYHKLAERRHHEIARGLDPFRKENRVPSSKNSPVRRMERRRYPVAKKELQLDARRVARELGRLPTRDDMTRLGRHPIKYYDSFFASWGEVCAAARATGMNDTPHIQDSE